MEVSVEHRGEVAVVSVSGSIDGLTSPELQRCLDAEIGAGHTRLVADFAAVDYTSSAGLRVLLGGLKDARGKGGDFRLAAVPAPVGRVLDLAGFLGIIKSFPDVDAAVASFAD